MFKTHGTMEIAVKKNYKKEDKERHLPLLRNLTLKMIQKVI